MSVVTYEGFIDESGQVRLLEQVALPIWAKVFVVVPQFDERLGEKVRHISTPRLVNATDTADFQLHEVQSNNYTDFLPYRAWG